MHYRGPAAKWLSNDADTINLRFERIIKENSLYIIQQQYVVKIIMII